MLHRATKAFVESFESFYSIFTSSTEFSGFSLEVSNNLQNRNYGHRFKKDIPSVTF